ncbi:receptor like protein 22-like [Miscanthus floridulus]|uniref:receptor like protein 22-like n=1 Tax=Miscanthus floridulus TaxID=154761 RepID=UPI00345802AC
MGAVTRNGAGKEEDLLRAAAVLYRYFRPALLLVSQHSPVLLLYFFALLSVLFVLQVSLCKNSSFHPNGRFPYDLESTTTLPSWKPGKDCCLWEGVGCSNSSSGHHVVTALDLSGFRLNSDGIHPVLFNLTSLRMLDLSMNNFRGYDDIPSVGFERLSSLTHLNLSTSVISGQVPIGISKLTNLVSLDISDRSIDIEDAEDDDYDIDAISVAADGYGYDLSVPYFHNIVANLSNLRELYLDGVSINSSAQGCFKALAKSVPHLRVLSLGYCDLQGDISSLSRLKSLVVINLSGNYDITPGPFPEFLMNFPNLRVLQLSGINLQGWFPRGTFLSKNLRVLDLSGNPDLSGHLPNFSNAASLETLWIDSTNFSYDKSSNCSNFKALTELVIDGEIISTNFRSSFGMLASLRRLTVIGLYSPRQLESLFSWFGGIKNLRSLEFDYCDFSMTIPSSIGNLKNLTSLVISESNLTTQTLSSITNIINLKFLKIECDDGFFAIPSAIGNMTNLERLHILNCWSSRPIGPIPHEVGALKKLESLVLPSMGLSGTIPSTIANLTQLTELQLGGNYFSGRIPSTIANLTQLTELQLEGNHLSGEIPTSLFTLPALGYLDLSENQLSGPINEFDAASSCLKNVYLEMNNLTGQIPQSLWVLPNLKNLNIEGNNLMGSVDLASLWGKNLTSLFLSYNKLTVIEGEGINNSLSTNPYQLVKLGLASCNMIKIPKLIMHAKHMIFLDLSSNKIIGDIPSWIWERWNYDPMWISLADNMFTGMELNSYVIPFSNTFYYSFNLSSNRLQGLIPMPYSSAEILDYSNNSFSSLLPNFTLYLSSTQYLMLSHNNISGYLPRSICHPLLEVLDLSYNNFNGLLPRCLMENSLSIINLRENQFKGMLPSNISIGCPIETINLNGNKIEGQLPRTLSKCTDLEVLDLGRNQITDTFPSWLGGLLNLRVLILRSNKFHGSIGHLEDEKYRGGHFSSLQIIDLASNNFSGKLHPQWFENLKSMRQDNNSGDIIYHPIAALYQDSEDIIYHPNIPGLYQDSITISYKGFTMSFERILTTLTAIDISDNALEGNIPTSIGNLLSLHVLNMSHNAFTGQIPPQLGSITALESLDLSSNMLSGEIPQELTDLTFLSTLNLSNNQLDGRIPQSRQFDTFQESSFDGNAGLCGPPLSKKCGPSDIPSETHLKNSSHGVDVVLFLFVGVGFGVGFAAAILLKLDYWISRWFHIFRILC